MRHLFKTVAGILKPSPAFAAGVSALTSLAVASPALAGDWVDDLNAVLFPKVYVVSPVKEVVYHDYSRRNNHRAYDDETYYIKRRPSRRTVIIVDDEPRHHHRHRHHHHHHHYQHQRPHHYHERPCQNGFWRRDRRGNRHFSCQ